jgi:hypothetical protein
LGLISSGSIGWGGNGFCIVNDFGGQVKSTIGCRGKVDGGETISLKTFGVGGSGEGYGRVRYEVIYLWHALHIFLDNHLISPRVVR